MSLIGCTRVNKRKGYTLAGIEKYCLFFLLGLGGNSFADNVSTVPKHFEAGWEGFTQYEGKYTKAFYRDSAGTPSGNTGPYKGAENSNYYVYFETSSGAAYEPGNVAYLVSPSTTAEIVSFYYHMYGADIGTLAVEVNTGSGWEGIWEISGQQHTSSGAAWTQKVLNIANYSSPKQIRFKAIAKGGYRGDIAIDHMFFSMLPETTVTYQYDALGRLVCTGDKLNGDRNYQYDDGGNRKSITVGECGQ